MLVASFEKVAIVAKREENLTRDAHDLHEQIRGELDWVWVTHNEEVIGLRTVIDVPNSN